MPTRRRSTVYFTTSIEQILRYAAKEDRTVSEDKRNLA